MKKLEQLYEGKAKKVFATDEDGVVIVDYKDDATAFNGEKKGTIMGKGVVNNKMSNYVFGLLEKDGVPTHFIKELSDRETAVKKVSIVPLEVIVRNVAAGSFSKRMGVPDLMILFTNTVSHKMVTSAVNEAKKNKIPIARSHSSSISALNDVLSRYCAAGTS